MAAKSFTLTTAAAKTQLSDVYGDGVGVVNPANDIPYRHLILQAEAADIKIGDNTITGTNYGVLAPSAAPAAPVVIGAFDAGPIKLSQLFAIGAGGKLHILGIPF
jgi:hypothetical protein